jgi:hypothetical protein
VLTPRCFAANGAALAGAVLFKSRPNSRVRDFGPKTQTIAPQVLENLVKKCAQLTMWPVLGSAILMKTLRLLSR